MTSFWPNQLLVFLTFGFFLLHAAENMQIALRVRGARQGSIASGYQSAMEGMLFNRVGAVVFHLMASLFVELGGMLAPFIKSILVACVFLFIFNLALQLRIRRVIPKSDWHYAKNAFAHESFILAA